MFGVAHHGVKNDAVVGLGDLVDLYAGNYGYQGTGTAELVGLVTAVNSDGSIATLDGDRAGAGITTSTVVTVRISAAQKSVGDTRRNPAEDRRLRDAQRPVLIGLYSSGRFGRMRREPPAG